MESKHVYVGLTNNIRRRKTEYKKKNYKISSQGKFDTVKQYFIEIGKEIPEPIIIVDGLNGYEAQEKENEILQNYINNGWTPINISKTGKNCSSLGSVGYGKWNFEECLKAVSQCSTRSEFARRFPGANDSVRRHGWEHILPSKQTIKRKYYTKDECIEHSKQYSSFNEIKEKDVKLYNSLLYRNMVLKCFPKKELTLSFKECSEIASRFDSCKDFRKKESKIAYYALIKMGWKWCDIHKKEAVSFSYEECADEVKKYNSQNQFSKQNHIMFKFCKNKGWLDDLLPLKKEKTINEIVELAKTYKTRNEFREAHMHLYFRLQDADLLQDIFGDSKKIIITEEYAVNESKKYTMSDFMKKRWYLYRKCRENGWIEKLKCIENPQKSKVKKKEENLEKIKKTTEIALLCKTKKEFREKYPDYYSFASRNKLLKNFGWLKGCKKEYTFEECEQKAKDCKSLFDFQEKYPSCYVYARNNKWLQQFIWLYKKYQKNFSKNFSDSHSNPNL